MKKLVCFLLIVALFVGILSPMAFAATVGATSYSDLAAAIAAAPADGTTITTIALENSFSATGGALTIAPGQNIVLTSTAGNIFTFTQATAGQRHFSVAGSLTLENVTLGGPGGTTLGGGVNVSGGSLTVADGTTITNCNVNGAGGAASLTHNSTFTMTGGAISDNTATTGGGALDIENGYATISGGTISGNVVTSASGFGGGIYLKAANLTMSGGELSNNRANNGGGIYVDNSGFITMTGGTISNNVATANGGGIFTAQYTSNNPLPPNSYLNLIIGSAVVFTGNVAGSGARIPPSNVAPPSTQIQTTNTSSVFGNPLNNLDINYFGAAGVMVMYLTVTFSPGTNGTFPPGTVTQQNIPTTNSPLVPASVPVPVPNANYGFIGWSSDGGTTILTSADVLTTPISNNTTYVAQYAPPIALIFNWQDNATPTTQTVTPVQVTGTYANALSQAMVPTLADNVFRGWFTTPYGSTSGVQILPTSIVAIGTTNPTTLYAWWVPDPTVTITFLAQGGAPVTQVVPGRVVGNTYAATLAAITTPTYPGLAFSGWFDASSGGNQITNSSLIPAGDATGNITVYAQWVPIEPIAVTFLAQGGTPDGQVQTVVSGNTYAAALSAITQPTQMGHDFIGWFTAPTGGVQILPTTLVTAATDQYLYAHWVGVTVAVTFDAQGGTPATQLVSGLAPLSSYGPVFASIVTPTRPGYTFQGWYQLPNGGGSRVNQYATVPLMDMTVYAFWTPTPPITVTFDAQGGTPTDETEEVTPGNTYAAALAAVDIPARTGFVFQGWFTTPSGVAGGVQVLDTTVVTATTAQTLYARWIPDPTVTLTFDAQGGTPDLQVVPGNTSGSSYAPILAAVTTPTLAGYTFDGWFDAQIGGNPIAATNTVSSTDTTLYAQWTQIPAMTVTFNANGGVFNSAYFIPGAGAWIDPNDNTFAYYEPVFVAGTFLQAMSAMANPDPPPPAGSATYYFNGWWTTENDPGDTTTGAQVRPTDTVWDPGSGAGSTLYANWSIQPTVTLTFFGNSGTPMTQQIHGAVPGMELSVIINYYIQAPTRPGFTLTGWVDQNGVPVDSNTTIPDTNIYYVAQWTANPPIEITFLAQGGTPDGQVQMAVPGDTYAAVLSAIQQPTRLGYAFAGWFDASTGGTQILPTTTVTATIDQYLYAHWVSVTVTVTFDAGSGTPTPQIVPGLVPGTSFGPVLASIATPTQPAFLFNGWHDLPQGKGGSTVSQYYLIPPMDMTVYAWWTDAPTFLVTFDAAGGTPTGETASVTTGSTYAAALAAVDAPTLTGFFFQGWFTTPSGGAGGVQILDTTIVTATAPQTLYARWIADPTVTITFDGNGGTPGTQVVSGRVVGSTYAATLSAITTPTLADNAFVGWFTTQDSGTQITASSIITAGNITLYAHWISIPPVIITFDAQGGTPDGQTWQLEPGAPYGDALSQITTPARPGYVFAGWFTTQDGDTSGVQILDNTIVTATADQTLYAHWIAVGVSITFDGNSGTPTTQVISGKMPGDTFAISLASITSPTRAFYEFQGWFTAPTGGDPITDTSAVPDTDTIVYAQWAPIPVTLTFDALGAAPAEQVASAMSGDTFAVPLATVTTPTMPGNIFVGWFTQIIGGTQINPSDIVTQDTTLYAQFVPTPPIDQGPIFREDVTLTETHYAYLIGESVDRVAPTNAITRAEVASVILRIVSDETRAAFWTLENPFPDVPNNGGAWFSNAVSVINNMGIMTGFPDGTFGPNQPITRAEVVTVMTRFLSSEMQYSGTVDMFPDISTSWARDNINLAAELGWVQGCGDGNFNPNANITRAEFATMVNRMLSRTTIDIDTANMRAWIDNANTSAWFYWAMQIASNSAPGASMRNWAALQLPNAKAEDAII
ncbi:MAG: InlB B-repeat-containing protein [Oscillospiraceae bacterium]|nr:InlB B-repeat-containing protein [Oscillospiraceae bacterium]